MDAPKGDRIKEFFRRLDEAGAAGTHDEAFDLVTALLNAVENEMTTIPFDPPNWQTDGRMYPPQADAYRPVPGHPGVRRYRSRGHNMFIAENGAIEIAIPPPDNGGTTAFAKVGADGRPVQRPHDEKQPPSLP